ncbi:hypothetical protein HYW21_02685 [Candidatus Woesearchaeota archaeon]|nr:hypothetical protein [Candidatus Woesearchaeota archaeon]
MTDDVNGVMSVLVYDRNHQGSKRLSANLTTLRTGLNGTAARLVGVNRYNSLASDRGAADALSENPLPYGALVVVGGSLDERDVLELAECAFSETGLGRVVYLHAKGTPRQDLSARGMTTFELQSRDGYLTSHDVESLASILQSYVTP